MNKNIKVLFSWRLLSECLWGNATGAGAVARVALWENKLLRPHQMQLRTDSGVQHVCPCLHSLPTNFVPLDVLNSYRAFTDFFYKTCAQVSEKAV